MSMKLNRALVGLLALTLSLTLVVACADDAADDTTDESGESTSTQGAGEETAGAKPYPLDVCIVSGEELGSMGDPIVKVYDGQTVKFCCENCVPEFEKNKEKYLGEIEAKK